MTKGDGAGAGLTEGAGDPPPLRRAGVRDAAALVALQRAAYEPLIEAAGGTPLPLLADYGELLETSEVWVAGEDSGPFDAALILQHQPDATLVWSVAVRPGGQSKGVGRRLLAFAEDRARAAGRARMRLYTSVKFLRNREIYRRFGYREVGEEEVGAREPPWIIVNMEKPLSD